MDKNIIMNLNLQKGSKVIILNKNQGYWPNNNNKPPDNGTIIGKDNLGNYLIE